MRTTDKKTIIMLIGLVSISLLPGCTNWKQRYDNLLMVHNNLQGQLEYERQEKNRLVQELTQSQQRIDELQRKIEDQQQTPAQATGFGEGYNVAFDPSAGTITVTLPNTILFVAGEAKLIKATSTELNHILSVLQQQYPGRPIDVVGHTDSDPIDKSPWRDNWQLSTERALAVLGYMVKRGIAEDRIRAVGCGPSRPVASNRTVAGKAQNRRVEIVVHMR